MIDWSTVSQRLHAAARASGRSFLVLTMPLPHWPEGSLAHHREWHCWHRPDEDCHFIGLGAALRFVSADKGRFTALSTFLEGLRAEVGDAPLIAFLGFAFWPQAEAAWPNLQLVVPELLIGRRGDGYFVQLACARERIAEAIERWRQLWRRWRRPPHSHPAAPSTWQSLFTPLTEQAFLARARAALAAIARGEIEKAVLSSQRRFRLAPQPDIDTILTRLRTRYPHCAIYGVGSDDAIFLGASPERLVTLDGRNAQIDALAGTHWRAGKRPLADEKNRREHECVARAIGEALSPLCEELAVPTTSETIHLAGLSHWRRRIRARIKPEASLCELLSALHPTPAVGGAPRDTALAWLARHGERRPAWYSGGIGWIDLVGAADIAVALRCALINRDQVTLFAGAGFVAGSEVDDEAAEIAAKIASLRRAMTRSLATRQVA